MAHKVYCMSQKTRGHPSTCRFITLFFLFLSFFFFFFFFWPSGYHNANPLNSYQLSLDTPDLLAHDVNVCRLAAEPRNGLQAQHNHTGQQLK